MRGTLINGYKTWVAANAVAGGAIAGTVQTVDILGNHNEEEWLRSNAHHSFARRTIHYGVVLTTASTYVVGGSLITGLVAATVPVSLPLYYYHSKNLLRLADRN